jgi:two-component system NtrC family sensor kinase
MEKSSFQIEPPHEGTEIIIRDNEMDKRAGQDGFIIARTWLNVPRWMLVVKQKKSEALSDVNHANYATLIFLHISALVIVAVSVLITGYMIRIIKKRDIRTDQLNEQLLQASKMAAVGELSAGIAHEINNPLAIILTERQILTDCLEQPIDMDEEFREQLTRSISQIDVQINRCKRITHNLLRFSRRSESRIESVNVNLLLKEIVELMEKEASSNGIEIIADFEESIPTLLSDTSQLQQVFLNMMNNAIDALEKKPYGRIFIKTVFSDDKNGVEIIFADTGSGISEENIEKIFDPFFTTKPVGKGTGLGLSISYSIIKHLGGDIIVTGEYGKGSEFHIYLPFELHKGVIPEMEAGKVAQR